MINNNKLKKKKYKGGDKIKNKREETTIHYKPTIKLLKHQLIPLKYIVGYCKKQRGILINHYMGTGKTITALVIAKNFPQYKKIIIVPEEIKYVWELEQHKIEFNSEEQSTISYIFYKNLKTIRNLPDIKNTIVFMDEAHHILDVIGKNKDITLEKSLKIIKWLQSAKKIVLLTGTPIYNKESDIIYLINIAAGKTLIPYLEKKFEDKYYQTHVVDSFFRGWFWPAWATTAPAFAWMIFHFYGVFKWAQGATGSIWAESYLDKIQNIFGVAGTGGTSGILSLFFHPIGIGILMVVIAYIIKGYNLNNLKTLNYDKLTHDIQPYISFFKFNTNLTLDNAYPISKIIYKEVEYNSKQIDFWIRMTLGRLTVKELVLVGISKNVEQAEMFGDIDNESVYIDKGRVIGNIIFKEKDKNIYPIKFEKILKIIKKKNNIMSSVVYSNFFTHGIKLFSQFLDNKNIDYKILLPSTPLKEKQNLLNDFKHKKYKILLIHPKFTEGVSILGARQMHILEPIIQLSRNDQLKARVVRYHSHHHLPKEERKVEIYQWYCSINSLMKKLHTTIQKMKEWQSHNLEVIYWNRKKKFTQDLTPDAIVLSKC